MTNFSMERVMPISYYLLLLAPIFSLHAAEKKELALVTATLPTPVLVGTLLAKALDTTKIKKQHIEDIVSKMHEVIEPPKNNNVSINDSGSGSENSLEKYRKTCSALLNKELTPEEKITQELISVSIDKVLEQKNASFTDAANKIALITKQLDDSQHQINGLLTNVTAAQGDVSKLNQSLKTKTNMVYGLLATIGAQLVALVPLIIQVVKGYNCPNTPGAPL